jgi:lactate dehydrogenase-like 2-hydroxyacid dehydrogenase
MMNFKILVTRDLPGKGIELLKQTGASVDVPTEDRPLARAELLARVKGVHAILSMLSDRIDTELMDAAGPQLKIVSNFAVGYDNIDLGEAKKRKIRVTNTPDVLTDATAELAWALLFAAARNVIPADACVRQGRWGGWGPKQFLGQQLSGSTLGVIGVGRIGTSFALKSSGFGMKVLYYARRENNVLNDRLNARRVDIETLLRESDFISLHLPLAPETRYLLDRERLSLIRSNAVVINTARGPIIEEDALADFLAQGRIAAAGLDVYEKEPTVNSKLLTLPNVVLLPHIGSATFSTRSNMAQMTAQAIVDCLGGKEPQNIVV